MHLPENSALRSVAFRYWMSFQTISLIGSWAQVLAESWLAYRLSGTPFTLGLMTFAAQAPSLILAPWGGILADRFDERKILLTTQAAFAAQAIGMSVFYFMGGTQIWILVALALWQGIFGAFDAPARQSFVVRLIDDRRQLSSAISMNSIGFNIARFIGPGIAGIIIVKFGEGACFVVNALSYVPFLAILPFVPAIAHRKAAVTTSLRQAFAYVRQHPRLSNAILGIAAASLFIFPYGTMLPAYVKEVLYADVDSVGALTSVAAIGALFANLLLARFRKRSSPASTAMRALVASALMLAILGACSNRTLSFFVIFLLSCSIVLAMVSTTTLIQSEVDDAMRGKVIGLYLMSFIGIGPFGSLALGAIAAVWGVPVTLELAAAGMAASIWWLVRRRRAAQRVANAVVETFANSRSL